MGERAAENMTGRMQAVQENAQQRLAKSLKASIKRFFNEFRVIRRALRHPQVPWYGKAVAGRAVLYVVSPIQLIPNFIPIIGQMDDVLVVGLCIKFLNNCVRPHVLDECHGESGPSDIVIIPVTLTCSPKSAQS
jgi:uncharacterized membrane protein YkvA (DUF1232 family)